VRKNTIRSKTKRVNWKRRKTTGKKGPSDEAGLLSDSTGVYRKHRWFETTFLPFSLWLVLTPILVSPPTPYSSLRVSSILSKRDSKEKRGKNGCIYVINFRPSIQASRRHHPGRIDRHLLLSSIENMRGREGTIRKSRETIFNRENYRIAWLPSFLFSWIPTNVCTELQSIFAYSSRFSHAAYYGL